MSVQVDKAKWGIYESTLLFPKQLDFFLRNVLLIPKNWEQGVSLAGKPEQLERGRGVMHGRLASRAPGKSPLCTMSVALDPSRRNARTVSCGNTGRRAS